MLPTKIHAPSDAAGYIIFNIGSAKTASPAAHGIIINIDAKNENDNLLLTVFISLTDIAEDIAGTSAVQNDAVIASGKCIIVVTLESIPRKPHCFSF